MPMTYQRGSKTTRKRVARLEPGDVILVQPGTFGPLRNDDGTALHDENGLVRYGWYDTHKPGVVSVAVAKTGALLAEVRAVYQGKSPSTSGFYRRTPTPRVVETTLGNLTLPGTVSVMVVEQ